MFNAVSAISQSFTCNSNLNKLNLRKDMYDFLFVILLLSVAYLHGSNVDLWAVLSCNMAIED